MTPSSHFYELAYMIKVSDVCSALQGIYDGNLASEYIYDQWMESEFDPMEQIALVTVDNKIEGWFGFDMLQEGKRLCDCMELIKPEMIMSSDTPLLEAISAFSNSAVPFLLLLRGQQFSGLLSYADLNKLPFQLCLFALLIDLEMTMLKVIQLSPSQSASLLSAGQSARLKDIYAKRGYHNDLRGNPYVSKLLECTTITQKFSILRKYTETNQAIPELSSKFCKVAEDARNAIAHPSLQSVTLLPREALLPFIVWAEKFEREMQSYLSSHEYLRPITIPTIGADSLDDILSYE